MKYVAQGLQPFSLVEQEPFKVFVKDLLPNAKMMTRVTLRSMIDDASKEMKNSVTEGMPRKQHPVRHTRKCTIQHLASVMHFGRNVEDPHLQPKLLKMCAPSSCCAECYQVELLVPGSGKTAEDHQRQGRGGHQSHLHRLEGSNVQSS
ncbi:hypothetical protein AAFF_G00216650 [Aldrovandia affinis]|uniref:Uncharacterized protein n=1 Tax=Aldrovandia affinis TaxID=143900 RepID=A0AAD7W4M5_9TELE|nr:hypothetical protein AAFF_G00216650 [Aldrovandia affinis]